MLLCVNAVFENCRSGLRASESLVRKQLRPLVKLPFVQYMFAECGYRFSHFEMNWSLDFFVDHILPGKLAAGT